MGGKAVLSDHQRIERVQRQQGPHGIAEEEVTETVAAQWNCPTLFPNPVAGGSRFAKYGPLFAQSAPLHWDCKWREPNWGTRFLMSVDDIVIS